VLVLGPFTYGFRFPLGNQNAWFKSDPPIVLIRGERCRVYLELL